MRVHVGVFGKPVDLVCDILALHLVQVVLSPQNPLESPEDIERVALTLGCRPDIKRNPTHSENFDHLCIITFC